MIVVGTAGWSIIRGVADRFPAEGSGLERYAAVMTGAEVNSSFYRRHRPDTWRRWAQSVPENFRFAVKMPRRISHELRLEDCEAELDIFLGDIEPLRAHLGPLLLQLPPKLRFDPQIAEAFFTALRQRHAGRVVIEPRHPSWAEGRALLGIFGVSYVLADPDPADLAPLAAVESFCYLRLHGSPRLYYSAYSAEQIRPFFEILTSAPEGGWCIFDNTASGAALADALAFAQMSEAERSPAEGPATLCDFLSR